MKKPIIIIILTLLSISTFAQNSPKPRRLEVLFLGDNGHHKPVERLPSIMSALGNKGINFTYTNKLEDLNLENLNRFDALMIYANWDEITPQAETALLAYVASGKGILPIHCASFCFRNSPEYVKMVGGQFWKHTTDTISANIVQPNHQIMNGLSKLKAFDETYLHSKLQADNNVLMNREIKADQTKDRPETKTEPYTWTRNYGKGRVFYTAFGHDEQTWENPDFHKLLENAIIWAVDDQARVAHAGLNPQPLVFRNAKLPNYEKRPDPQVQQLPLSPEESVKLMQIPVDFNLEVFASEPNVMHPIAMAWDEKGRLYVLITKDYPNERKETGGSDYILLCEDTNKDGKADKFTHFADGLSIPTGMVFANGGLIVSQAPNMLFLKDNDGDDKADEKKILFSGFGTGDTHAGPSNLHYGFDNWIWGCVGYSGIKTKFAPKDSVNFGQGFFRFKADGSDFEHITSTSNNTWGFSFNETGDVFGSTANNSHGWYMAIPHRNILNGSTANNGSRSTDSHKDMKTITPRVRQVDVWGGYTAAAGHNFYTARAFPKKYWNKTAFVCEPTGHVVHQNVMEKKGTDYEDVEGFNLLAGADEWVSPVFAEVGPDGAVWIADWYSFIIQHNPKPTGFTMGVGNAYETNLRDYTHGRIYRVGYNKAPAYTPLSLSKNHPNELINALKNDNQFWRMTAQRLLIERGQKDVVPTLIELTKDQSLDEIGINPTVIHALRTLEGLGVLNEPNVQQALYASLTHQCAGVRKNAIQILPRNTQSVNELLQKNLLNDKEPLVVLNTLLALSEMPLTAESEKALMNRLEQSNETNDRWLPDAFASVLTSNKQYLLKKLVQKLTQNSSSPKVKANEMPAAHHDHSKMMQDAAKTTAITASNKPDLVITRLILTPANPVVRDNINVKIEVKNQGGIALEKGVIVPLDIRFAGMGRKVDVISRTFNEGIPAGESIIITKSNNGPWTGDINFGSDVSGDFSIVIDLDKANTIAESDEKNNTFTQKVNFSTPQNMTNYALERAMRGYSAVSAVDSVVQLLKQFPKMEETTASALLRGITDGWNYKRKVTVNETDKAFLVSLKKNLVSENNDRLSRLMQAWQIKTDEVADPNKITIVIKSVKEAMSYDKKEFTVPAGKTVEIIFENSDAMQHNLVIGKPKSLEIIGKAATKMIMQKDALQKSYIPNIPQIIASTPLVNSDGSYKLTFKVPEIVGDYPYVCTFPGHWSIMNGVMKVVK
jgi:putative membrane-bound dehydrogenase-like protein